jgi:hypothetical protein
MNRSVNRKQQRPRPREPARGSGLSSAHTTRARPHRHVFPA